MSKGHTQIEPSARRPRSEVHRQGTHRPDRASLRPDRTAFGLPKRHRCAPARRRGDPRAPLTRGAGRETGQPCIVIDRLWKAPRSWASWRLAVSSPGAWVGVYVSGTQHKAEGARNLRIEK